MKKVLVIDDESDVANLMMLFLSGLGYDTDIFLSCEEAVAAIEENSYWAIFCDYMMPKITGDKLYSIVKNKDAGLAKRFVVITGAVLDERLDDFLKGEQVKVINKPFKLDEIKNILIEFERL
jgi:CheY-like chemotaxis protein